MILKCWNKQEREIYDMNSMQIPAPVEQIIHTLNSHGYEAFAVGGCVRDTLLGRKPGDWDITTSARPEQVKALFRRTIDTGIQHGTVTIMMDRTGYEVTTYRIDGEYEDGRHPKQVEFTSDLLEDLRRRDFTAGMPAPVSGALGSWIKRTELLHRQKLLLQYLFFSYDHSSRLFKDMGTCCSPHIRKFLLNFVLLIRSRAWKKHRYRRCTGRLTASGSLPDPCKRWLRLLFLLLQHIPDLP